MRSPSSAPSTCCDLLPRGTHDWSRFVRPAELAGYARRAGADLIAIIGLAYNPLTRMFRLVPDDLDVNYLAAFRRHDVSPHARSMSDAVLFDLDGTLADTAGDLAGAVNRVRKRPRARPGAVASAAPVRVVPAPAGCCSAAWAIASDHPEFPALRERSSRITPNACRKRRSSSRASRSFSMQSKRADSHGASSPTRRRASRSRWWRALELDQRAATIVSGDTTPHPKPHPAPLLHAAHAMSVASARLRLRRRRSARHRSGQCGGHADARCAVGLHRRTAARAVAGNRWRRPPARRARLAAVATLISPGRHPR